MVKFSISDSNKVPFIRNIELFDNQYKKILLTHADVFGKGISNDRNSVLHILSCNSSLRLNFGFSFESEELLKESVTNVTNKLSTIYPKFDQSLGSDHTGSWVGFLPFGRAYLVYKTLSELIEINSLISLYYSDFCKEFVKDRIFVSHALTRNHEYRFEFFKSKRNDPDQLAEAFDIYINAHKLTLGQETTYRDLIEEDIGCHYLKHPNLFFELLNIHTLKGNIING